MSRTFFLTCVDLEGALPSRSHWIARHFAARGQLAIGSMRVVPPQAGMAARVGHWFAPFRTRRFEYAGAPAVRVDTPIGPFSRLGALGDRRAIEALERSVMSHGGEFDVCIAEEPWSGVAALRLKQRGVFRKVVFDDVDRFAEFMPASRRIGRALTERLERESIRGADAVVAVSRHLVERASELGVRSEWIPNGVTWEEYRVPVQLPPELSCVYTGSLHEWAGVLEATRAVGMLIDEGRPATLDIYGFGDHEYEHRLRATIEQGRWTESIRMHGRIDPSDLPQTLVGARVGLVTRTPTPLATHMFPLKVPEYWAAGLGVVGTDIGEIGDVLREGPCGRAVQFDPAAIAQGIREVSDGMTLPGMVATREAARIYAWSSLLKRLEGIVDGLSAGGRDVG